MVTRWLRPGRARREGLTAEAERLGLSFDAEPPFELKTFDYGTDRASGGSFASNVVHGHHGGREVTVFEWKTHDRGESPGILAIMAFDHPQRQGARTVRVTVAAVELDAPVHFVALRRGKRPRSVDRKHHVPTGHAELDGAFVCVAISREGAPVLADERFARLVLDGPKIRKVDFRHSRLVVTLPRRKPEQLAETLGLLTALADAVPPSIYRPADAE